MPFEPQIGTNIIARFQTQNVNGCDSEEET